MLMIQPIKKLIILSLILFASMSWAEDTLLSIPFDGKKLELNYKRGAKKQSGNQTLGVTLEPANMDEMEQTLRLRCSVAGTGRPVSESSSGR